VPLVGIERRLHARQRGRHVRRLVDRDERVLNSVPQPDRAASVLQREAPVAGTQQVVVDHPADSPCGGGQKTRRRLLARLRRGEQAAIGRRRDTPQHALDEPRVGAGHADQSVADGRTRPRPAAQGPQRDAQRQRHAPGRIGASARHRADDRRRPNAVGQLVRAGQRVRAAGRHADDGEVLTAQVVGEVGGVGGEARERPARQRIGAAEPRPADHDVAHAELVDDRLELGTDALRRADRAVQGEHEQPVGGPAREIGDPPAVAQPRHALVKDMRHEMPACQ